jgi:hypothetical protein
MTRIHGRFFLQHSATVGAALLIKPARAKSVNEKLNMGFIGTGDQGNGLLSDFKAR